MATKATAAPKTIKTLKGFPFNTTRAKLGLNQKDFWAKVGVTQSGGSRYESGRPTPDSVNALLHIAYGTVKDSDAAMKLLK